MKTCQSKYSGKSGYKHIVIIKILIKTMQHCILQRWRYLEVELRGKWEKEVVPGDVEKGYFAVVAVKCENPKRFVVELGCLTNPGFLRLLKKAGEEFGFKHEGAIAIPCEPDELQMILQEMKNK